MFYANFEFENVDGNPRFVVIDLDDHHDSDLDTLMYRVALVTETMDNRHDTNYVKHEETILITDSNVEALNEIKTQIDKLSAAGYTPRNLYSAKKEQD